VTLPAEKQIQMNVVKIIKKRMCDPVEVVYRGRWMNSLMDEWADGWMDGWCAGKGKMDNNLLTLSVCVE
jgi:hypothetical protein